MNRFTAGIKSVPGRLGERLSMKGTDSALVNKNSKRIWSNEDLDPVSPDRRNWGAWTFASYWLSESWGPTAWSVGSSMVAGGLLWWHALLACIVGHILGALMTVWNGRGGAVYHISFPVWMRGMLFRYMFLIKS